MACSRDEDPCSLRLLFLSVVRRVLEKTAGAYVVHLRLGALPPGGEGVWKRVGARFVKSTGYVSARGFGRRTRDDRLTLCMEEVSL